MRTGDEVSCSSMQVHIPDPDYTSSERARANFRLAAKIALGFVVLLWLIQLLNRGRDPAGPACNRSVPAAFLSLGIRILRGISDPARGFLRNPSGRRADRPRAGDRAPAP